MEGERREGLPAGVVISKSLGVTESFEKWPAFDEFFCDCSTELASDSVREEGQIPEDHLMKR